MTPRRHCLWSNLNDSGFALSLTPSPSLFPRQLPFDTAKGSSLASFPRYPSDTALHLGYSRVFALGVTSLSIHPFRGRSRGS